MSETNVQKTVEASTAAMAESGSAATTALQELTKAYQDLATKNAANLKSAIQALAAVKSPSEFIEVEQRLIREGVQAAVADSQNIANLTAAVFTSAFEPVKKRIQSMQKPS
jgi:hypothetical protein